MTPWHRRGAWIVAILLLGLALALLDGQGSLLRGWLAYSLLASLGVGSLSGFQRLLRLGAPAGRAALAAFLVRLAVGVLLTMLLPLLGYHDENAAASQAGYFYNDAYFRDRQAWKLANSGRPLMDAFSEGTSVDQYGSMLFLSAGVYRGLSPDAHRQMAILVLTAAAGAWGVLFVWKAAQEWFGGGVARPAGWIFALYPEAVLLGASQMREGFVLSGVAMALWGVIQLRLEGRDGQRQAWWAWFAAGILLLLVFHPPSALAALVVLLGVWLLDPAGKRISARQLALFAGILVVAVLAVSAVWERLPSLQGQSRASLLSTWLQHNFNFQAYQSVRASGWLQKLIDEAGEGWKPVILILYGVAQPVLPAAIFEPAPPIWMAINTLRGLGWYALAPFLVYAVFAALRASPGERKGQTIWLSLAAWAWILLSSANAGGDLWDNPRYRAIFLAFQALLAAWAWGWASAHRDVWLRRWLTVEAVFVLFFFEWYASRYTRLFGRLFFWEMIAAILILSALILLGGWIRDRKR